MPKYALVWMDEHGTTSVRVPWVAVSPEEAATQLVRELNTGRSRVLVEVYELVDAAPVRLAVSPAYTAETRQW